jgi:CBS domain containing-hemolysin-like protein
MKPVVGVMQAWSWLVFPSSHINFTPLPPSLGRVTEYKLTDHLNSIVISVFAIVILSVIGALFKSNHHSMTGSTDDPKDPAAVAATVFSAVIVYVVCFSHSVPLNSSVSFPYPNCSIHAPHLSSLQ